jgi:hypothetical protein
MNYKKQIIVVGNGSDILQHKNGCKIDSFECVVRMGSCKINGYEEYVGTKTDLYRSSWDRMFEDSNGVLLPIKNGVISKNFLFLEPDNDVFYESITDANNTALKKIFYKQKFAKHRFHELLSCKIPERLLHDYFIKNISNLYSTHNIMYMSIKQRIDAFKRLNNVLQFEKAFLPSGGICTLLYVLDTYKDYSVWITGFDGFTTKYYWRSNNVYFNVHSSIHERLFLQQLIKKNIIKVL